jgi:hypothetical protein
MAGIEAAAVAEWSYGLSGVTFEQIEYGLDTWSEDWPPSLPEFRSACLGKKGGKNEFNMDYVPECYRQRPWTADKKKMLSNDQREARREKIAANIDELKRRLRQQPTE